MFVMRPRAVQRSHEGSVNINFLTADFSPHLYLAQ